MLIPARWFLVISWINVFSFFVAAVTAALSSIGLHRGLKILKIIKSVVAGAYFFGILWSLTLGQQSQWAPIARIVGMISIPAVYIFPDLVGIRYRKHVAEESAIRVADIQDRIANESGG